MHILLLKEPRDGESGPDPYIKVDALVLTMLCMYFQRLSLQHSTFLLCISQQILTEIYYFDSTGTGITWT